MFVQASPAMSNCSETIYTLLFGQRARSVELGQAKKNSESKEVAQLRAMVKKLEVFFVLLLVVTHCHSGSFGGQGRFWNYDAVAKRFSSCDFWNNSSHSQENSKESVTWLSCICTYLTYSMQLSFCGTNNYSLHSAHMYLWFFLVLTSRELPTSNYINVRCICFSVLDSVYNVYKELFWLTLPLLGFLDSTKDAPTLARW